MDQPGYSLLNPGGSLNFEIPVSQIQLTHEEDEAAEEERIKEKELQDLLTNAFDDLIDDDYENDEDRSSLIHGQISYFSRSYSDEVQWDPTSASSKKSPKNEFVQESSEKSVKFLQQKTDICQNETSHDSEGSYKQSHDQNNWEQQYYLDHWIQDNSGRQDILPNNSDKHILNNDENHNIFSCSNEVPEDGTQVAQQKLVKSKAVKDGESLDIFSNGNVNQKLDSDHLRALYAARGREIERLQQALIEAKEKADKEFDILKCYLAKANVEKENYATSLKENKGLLNAANQSISRLEGECRSMEIQLMAVSENREELLQKLQAAEATIENLQSQLKELSKSENLVRAREQHTAIVNSINEKHNKEIYKYKVDNDELKENLEIKNEEVENLKKENERISKECESVKVEKAETVNRLIRALEESQRECQTFVKSGTIQVNNDDSDIVNSLKTQLKDTRRELELYVAAAELQILNLKEDISNEISVIPKQKCVNQGSLVTSLKSEVERSLACLQSKNEQLTKLQRHYQDSVSHAKLLEEKVTFAEMELSKAKLKIEEMIKDLESARIKADYEIDVKKDLDNMQKENMVLKEDLKLKSQRVEDLMASREELVNLVQQMKDEMTNLATQYEAESQKAVEACRDACLKLHERAMTAKGDELIGQLQLMQQEFISQCEKLNQELDDAKNMYLTVSAEKNELEQKLLSSWNTQKLKEIEELKTEYDKRKEAELSSLKQQLQMANTAKAMEEKKVKKEYERQLSDRLKKLKQTWLKDQDLIVQEKVLAKVKEELHKYMVEKDHDKSGDEISRSIEEIKELEERVRESENACKQQLANIKTQMEEEKAKAIKETSLKKDQYYQEKIQTLMVEKTKEREQIIIEIETKIAAEIETFLSEQKERYLIALKTLQESNAKEKNEILCQCELKLTTLKDEYKNLLEAQHENQKQQVTSADERVEKFQNLLVELETRLQRKDEEMTELVTNFQKHLKEKDDHLEAMRSKLMQETTEPRKRQEENVSVAPEDVARLTAKLAKGELEVLNAKAKLEEEEKTHQAIASKYKTLKDKVKKYHRYVHSKEREFADTLAKLMQENNQVPERIISMKNEVIAMLNSKLEEMQRQFKNNWDHAKLTQNKDEKANVADLKLQFMDSIQKIHSEVMEFLEECSNKATAKIHEDVATATWLLAERLDLTRASKETFKTGIDNRTKTIVEPIHITRLNSRSPSPTTTTNASSGRGTLPENHSSAAKDIEVLRGVTVQMSQPPVHDSDGTDDKIKKSQMYWMSTPFNPDALRGIIRPDENQPTFGLSAECSLIAKMATGSSKVQMCSPTETTGPQKASEIPAAHPTCSLSTGTWHSRSVDKVIPNQTVPEKLPISLTKRVDLEESSGAFAPLIPIPNDSADLRQALFRTFVSELAEIKSAFWQSVESTKKQKQDQSKQMSTK